MTDHLHDPRPEFTAAPPRSVLVVDDEPSILEAVKLLLECDGHCVDTANDAAEALEKFAPGKFDVVLSDYMMPGMKGDALAAAIQAVAPYQPIVFLTAHAELLQGTLQIPGVGIVSKPFTLRTLRQAIGRAVASV
jgi:CheY-like chemotaxis protein